MFTQVNGLYVPTTLANDLQASNAIAATFTNGIKAHAANVAPATVAAPANAPTVITPNRTCYMFACIAAGLSNTQAVAAVKARYGNVPTNAQSISWCRQANKQLAQGATTNQANVARRMQAILAKLTS